MNIALPEPSFRGASYPASASILVPDKSQATLVVDRSYVLTVAQQPDAARLVAEHHRHLFTVATHGALEAVRGRVTAVTANVRAGDEEVARIAGNLALLQPNRTVPGGDQPRTLSVQLNIAGALALAAGTVACDWLLIRNLAADVVGPELAASPLVLFPIAFPILAATGALKLYPLLRHREEPARAEAERKFARLLPWTLPLLMLAVAKRLAGWTVNPVDAILGEINATLDLALTLGAYVLQLGGMAVVAAAALMAACGIARATRPSSSKPNEEYAEMRKQQLVPTAQERDANLGTLGALKARLAELEGQLNGFLDEASAELLAEQLELESTARRLAAMRPTRGPAPGAGSGRDRVGPRLNTANTTISSN